MSLSNTFWFCAGLLVASGLAFVLPPLWRGMLGDRRRARLWTVSTVAVSFVALSLGFYRHLGNPASVDLSVAAASAPHPLLASSSVQGKTDALDEATRKLADRLQRSGGTDSEWELLAQSYEYMGDPAAAGKARSHAVEAQHAAVDSQPAAERPALKPDAAFYRKRVEADPRDAPAWLALAQMARAERSLPEAQSAYQQVIALKAMNADSWADYADVLASASGRLSGAPASAINQALALNARHAKALWLNASLAIEERRYADALAGWRRLRRVIADSDSDARIVDANIREAEALANGTVAGGMIPAVSRQKQQAGTAGVIRGTVDIDPSLQSRLAKGMTLFIYAKSVGAAGPPLAVQRLQPEHWPVTFQLDDSQAMLPGRQLSAFDTVIVEARLSKSGQALAQPGDLQALSDAISTRGGGTLKLRIAKVIG